MSVGLEKNPSDLDTGYPLAFKTCKMVIKSPSMTLKSLFVLAWFVILIGGSHQHVNLRLQIKSTYSIAFQITSSCIFILLQENILRMPCYLTNSQFQE